MVPVDSTLSCRIKWGHQPPPRILIVVIDAFNKLHPPTPPLCWVMMASVILGRAWWYHEKLNSRQTEEKNERAWDRQRLKECGSDPKSSIILIPLAMSCESIILHLSFILALLSENEAPLRTQALIDAVWPEGLTLFWRQNARCAGSKGVIVSGIRVDHWTDSFYSCRTQHKMKLHLETNTCLIVQ